MEWRVDVLCESDLESLLKKRIPPKTWKHSCSVAKFLADIAGHVELDPEKARLAGLLHDMCKGKTPAELLRQAQDFGLQLSPAAQEKPALLHGPVAAELCRRELGISDPEIYEAIYWHTTGKPGLNLLGLCLVLADFSEPLREYREAQEARTLFYREGLLPAVRYIARKKLDHARSRPPVDPATQAFVDWLDEVGS